MANSWIPSLQTRLYLLVLLAVIPAFGVIVYHAVQDRHQGAMQASRELEQLAQSVAFDYRLLVEGERQYLSAFAQLAQIRGDIVRCNRFISRMIEGATRYLNIGVIDRDGRLRCSALPFRGEVYLGDRAYFRDAIRAEAFAVGDFQIGRVTGKPSINFAMPVPGADGAPVGVVFSAVNLSWLNDSIAHTLPDGASTTLVDREGVILLRRPDPGGVIGQRLSDPSVFQTIQARDAHGSTRSLGVDGVLQLVGYAPLHDMSRRVSAYVLVAMPLAVAQAESDRRLVFNLIVLAAASLLMWLLARAFGARLVLRHIDSLNDAAERLGRGDLAARTGMAHGGDEFGRLARGFDVMAERVERQMNEQRRDEERIRRLNRVYAMLSRVNHTIVHKRERTELLNELCRILVEEGGYRFVWVGWVDRVQRTLRPVTHHGHDASFLDKLVISYGVAGTEATNPAATVVRDGRADVCNDLDSDARVAPWRDASRTRGYRSWGAFALRMQDEIVAVVNLHAREAGAFDADEQRLLTEVASDVSFALVTVEQEEQRREAEKRLTFLAYHDPVTELPNLLHYDDMLKALLERARVERLPFALLIVGLERMDEVTATFGQQLEGELLQLIAQRLRQSVRMEDILARGAGEHFNIVLPNADAEQATRTARHLVKVMEQPFAIQGMDIELGIAVGIALYPGHGEQLDVLDRCAHTALTESRKAGGGYAFYAPGQDVFSPERLALVSELRHAIENDELMLMYQPKVDLLKGEIAGVEALVRWRHPTRGMVPPGQFIPVAEQTGLIRAMTYWVMDAAARQSYNFRRAGFAVPVAINLSTLNLVDPRLPARLQNHCLTWGIDPGAIEIEITESAIMQDPGGTYQVLRRLSEMGHLLYIDDFGTGYSSLGYLKKLPVDALKIDQSFVFDMLSDKDAEQIVRSTIDLAHDLGLKVVAEGVESQEALDKLALLGGDMAQGFFIAQPMEADRFLEWLAASSWRARRADTQETQRGVIGDS